MKLRRHAKAADTADRRWFTDVRLLHVVIGALAFVISAAIARGYSSGTLHDLGIALVGAGIATTLFRRDYGGSSRGELPQSLDFA